MHRRMDRHPLQRDLERHARRRRQMCRVTPQPVAHVDHRGGTLCGEPRTRHQAGMRTTERDPRGRGRVHPTHPVGESGARPTQRASFIVTTMPPSMIVEAMAT